jgi:hypothetical protein
MLRPSLILALLILLCACGQKKQATETKFVISGVEASSTDTVNGSLMVSAFNPATRQFLRVKMGASAQSLTLPNGSWFFSGVYWDDTNTEGAQVHCALAQAELNGQEVSIDLSLTVNTCKQAVFTQPAFLDAGELQAIQVNQCDSFGALSANCATTPGVVASFKIVFLPYALSTLERPSFDLSGSISSNCIDTALSGVVSSATLIPSGSTNVPIPFVIQTFSSAGCSPSDFVSQFNFTHGLLTGDTGNTRVHDFNSTTDVTRLLIKDGSIGPLHATVAIPAETNYKFDLRNFVSGGRPPYTFSRSPVSGSLSGTIFGGSGAADVYTITATDADGVVTTFTLNTVVKSHHSIFSNIVAGSWTVNRSSSNYSMNAPGVLSEVAPGVARFINTDASGAVPADRYLLNEKPTSNLLTAPVDFTNAAWTSSSITRTNQGATQINNDHPHFLLDKTTGGVSGTMTQDLPARGGNHVGSIYLKMGTSRFAGLRLENPTHPTNACTGIVIDLVTGDTTAMAGCPFMSGIGLRGSQYLGNGWWRVWVTRQFMSTYTGKFIVYPAWNPGTSLSPAEVTSATGTILAFNPQLEGGDRPTTANPYVAARSNEFIENTANVGNFSLSSGTFLLDWHAREPEPNKRLLSFCNASTRVMEIGITSGRARVTGQFSSVSPFYTWGVQAANLQDISASSQNRIAFKVGGSIRLFNRGESAPVAVTGDFPATAFTRLLIGGDCNTGNIHNVGIRRFGFWAVQFEDVVLKEMANDTN